MVDPIRSGRGKVLSALNPVFVARELWGGAREVNSLEVRATIRMHYCGTRSTYRSNYRNPSKCIEEAFLYTLPEDEAIVRKSTYNDVWAPYLMNGSWDQVTKVSHRRIGRGRRGALHESLGDASVNGVET